VRRHDTDSGTRVERVGGALAAVGPPPANGLRRFFGSLASAVPEIQFSYPFDLRFIQRSRLPAVADATRARMASSRISISMEAQVA
jgi:hypothetical protein